MTPFPSWLPKSVADYVGKQLVDGGLDQESEARLKRLCSDPDMENVWRTLRRAATDQDMVAVGYTKNNSQSFRLAILNISKMNPKARVGDRRVGAPVADRLRTRPSGDLAAPRNAAARSTGDDHDAVLQTFRSGDRNG
jgi:hypothetical protein